MRETINPDYEAIALNALVWVLGDDGRAHRLLDLTGLDGDAIRARLGDPEMLAAVLDFLCAHEPDLLACAAALGEKPETLVLARERLTR
jgi:Protein of unknown function (DUF3572)